ncbi:MAG TPA: site-specific integrase [Candidatus Mcinerneyibacterium sp.]|nr:site-specific integrase [Candidatus Mcinerneyibacterium sp.]
MNRNYLTNFKISLLRVQNKQKRPYSDEELEKLLEKPDMDKCIFSEYRNWAIVNFLLGTGVRLKPLSQLQIKDISLENAIVDLRHTKNRKQRIIPLTKSLVNILFEYIDIRKGEKEDYLFCTIHGV